MKLIKFKTAKVLKKVMEKRYCHFVLNRDLYSGTYRYFDDLQEQPDSLDFLYYGLVNETNNNLFPAPSQEELHEWIMKLFKLHIQPFFNTSKEKTYWMVRVMDMQEVESIMIPISQTQYPSYSVAMENGLLTTLNHLLENEK